MNKQFTLLYGVRYEAATPPVDKYNRIANLDLNSTATQVDVVTPGQPDLSTAIIPARWFTATTTIGPRASVLPGCRNSSNPRPSCVAAIPFFTTKRSTTLSPSNIWNTSRPLPLRENLITSGTQVLTLQNGFPSISTITNKGGVNPNYRDGYAQLWTLGTETSFSQNWILDLTYTGTKGTDLDLLRAPNRAPLGTSPLNTQNELPDSLRQ